MTTLLFIVQCQWPSVYVKYAHMSAFLNKYLYLTTKLQFDYFVVFHFIQNHISFQDF